MTKLVITNSHMTNLQCSTVKCYIHSQRMLLANKDFLESGFTISCAVKQPVIITVSVPYYGIGVHTILEWAPRSFKHCYWLPSSLSQSSLSDYHISGSLYRNVAGICSAVKKVRVFLMTNKIGFISRLRDEQSILTFSDDWSFLQQSAVLLVLIACQNT